MKGSFFMGPRHTPGFEIREMTMPEPGAHDVLVKNMACGVCGTDIHIYHGEKGSAEVTPPVVLGHEYSGIVEKIGDKVTTLRPGDRVAIDPNRYCGICRPCRMGRKQNCQNLYALGVNTNGGFAEYSIVPEAQCYKINDDIDFDVAAMAEPLSCVIHGIDQADIRPGQTVAVIGGGAIGLLMVQMAKLSGASVVVLSEPISLRRQIGLEVGADFSVDPFTEDIQEKMAQYTGRTGADVVIECVGRPNAAQQALQLADMGATVLLFGVPPVDAAIPLPLFDVFSKELRIIGSRINPDTHQRAVGLISSGKLEIRKLITHTFRLEQLEQALHMQMSSDSIKVIVHPHD
ncbi:MAG TPA: zinc-dependent alcohol dehydrogenase family protein [Candidatus Atribacteria bacterium]|nr:zinc-dependent alcohol dehydrogenase family protein [Candidatus Atribacteria bacterium]HPT78003.1 zinc-dependent alcohol dehydrogenase family protein [Candidatus Atribacteria bacterium]